MLNEFTNNPEKFNGEGKQRSVEESKGDEITEGDELLGLESLEEEKSVINPELRNHQIRLMLEFLALLFKEVGPEAVLCKYTIIRKFNEVAIPMYWSRICQANVMYEKKTQFPPWSPKRQVLIVIPNSDTEHNTRIVENYVRDILIDTIEGDLNKLPINLSLIQKEYNKRINLKDPHLYSVAKQWNTSLNDFFFQTL